MDRAIALTEDVFRMQGQGRAENKPRTRIRFPSGIFHFMAGAVPEFHSVGLKAYAATRAGIHFVVILFDTETSDVLALLEADWLGRIRTGAASGVASKILARPEARIAGVIGAGGQAETQIEAIVTIRQLDLVKVFSRNRERRETLCGRLTGRLPCRIEPVSSAREAVEGSDIVTTITDASAPVFDGAWLQPGTHINAAGSNAAQRREIDGETVRRSTCIAVDSLEQAHLESGDLIQAVHEGALAWDRVHEFGDIVAGKTAGRTSPEDITLYESQGIAIEDVIVARYVYVRAIEEGRGQEVDFGERR